MPRSLPPRFKWLPRLAGIAIVVGVVVWWQRPPPEPVLNGRRLSEWIDPANESWGFWAVPREQIESIGGEAVPWLAWVVEHGKRSSSKSTQLPFDAAPDWIRRWVPRRWGGLRTPSIFDERRVAIIVLGRFGAKAAPAVPTLAKSLSSEDAVLADLVRDTLNNIGPAAWQVIEDGLQHGSTQTQRALLIMLDSCMQKHGGRMEGGLVPPPAAEMTAVVQALGKICRAPDAELRALAARVIGGWPADRMETAFFDPVIPDLIRLLSDTDEPVRENAIVALQSFGTKAAPAVPRLVELLDSPSMDVRFLVARALGYVDWVEKLSVPRLRVMLRSPDRLCRSVATEALAALDALQDEPTAVEISPAK